MRIYWFVGTKTKSQVLLCQKMELERAYIIKADDTLFIMDNVYINVGFNNIMSVWGAP